MPRKPALNPRHRRVFPRLGEAELAAAEHPELTLDDLGLDTAGEQRAALAFGTYSQQGLRNALEAYGLLKRVRERGLAPVEVRLAPA
jgi:hypothetical protein